MSQADLVVDLKAILKDSATKFTAASDADFNRHLDIAARDLARVKRRTLLGILTLVADQPNYAAPADILVPKFSLWGSSERKTRRPWQSTWPAILPTMQLTEGASGEEIYLDPAPTAAQIADMGADYKFWYFAVHKVGAAAADTTVKPEHRDLLLIRATAQALTELANNNVAKPVELGGRGVGSMPKNGTPAALADSLMQLFERMAA